MKVETVFQKISAAGFSIETDGQDLTISPSSKLTDDHREFIRKHKKSLISFLDDRENIREHFEERAAIQEYDAGLSREEAEKQARSNMRIYHYRITDKPDSWLVMIAPGYDIDEARHSLEDRFGDRLLDVKKYSFNAELFK